MLPARRATRWLFRHGRAFNISIYAPSRGERRPSGVHATAYRHFNPRPREGSDTSISCAMSEALIFQSTPPARGATSSVLSCRWRVHYFNPRPPRGERRLTFSGSGHDSPISIHAPREGSDHRHFDARFRDCISIHAPREGSDKVASICLWR